MKEHIRIIILHGDGNDGKCELCGKQDELRPYGPNGEKICFDCGMKDEKTTARQFQKILNGEDHEEEEGRQGKRTGQGKRT